MCAVDESGTLLSISGIPILINQLRVVERIFCAKFIQLCFRL